MTQKPTIAFLTALLGLFIIITPVFAHVVVRPNEAGAAAYQTFTINVPNERDIPTVGIRLVIPGDLQSVTPNVKPGWTITVKKTGEGEDAKVTEVEWTEGSIPTGQRDEFLFSTKTPAKDTTLSWKAYQTYEDGTVVSWDQDPKREISHAEADEKNIGPYSQTKIVNDLKDAKNIEETSAASEATKALQISFVALILSVITLGLQLGKKK